jgi:NAD(P)H-nitrite reductase large subunit
MLSPVLSGDKTIDDIMLHPHAWYSDKGIRFIAGDPAVRIDRPRKQVYTEKGEVVDYDRLILATGSKPFIPPIAGAEYRVDLERVQQQATWQINNARRLENQKPNDLLSLPKTLL